MITPLVPTGEALVLAWPPGPNVLTSLEKEFTSKIGLSHYTTANFAIINAASQLGLS